MPRILSLFAAIGLAAGLIGCQQPNVIDDLSETSYQLLDTDSTAVSFPQDVTGDIVVLGYIYTHCPDVCPMTTANMKQAREQLSAPDDVRFVTVTFDPLRDRHAAFFGAVALCAEYQHALARRNADLKASFLIRQDSHACSAAHAHRRLRNRITGRGLYHNAAHGAGGLCRGARRHQQKSRERHPGKPAAALADL